jgi:hypothetical protein
VLGGVSFDPDYLKQTFFPEMFEELVAQKMSEDRGNQLAMMVYPSDHDGDQGDSLLAASTGWGEGKPEVSRNLDDVFRGLTLGIKFQGTSADAIAGRWVQQSFLILGVLSLLMIGGLVLTYRSVSKEMALALGFGLGFGKSYSAPPFYPGSAAVSATDTHRNRRALGIESSRLIAGLVGSYAMSALPRSLTKDALVE